jgi:hypothetical protein
LDAETNTIQLMSLGIHPLNPLGSQNHRTALIHREIPWQRFVSEPVRGERTLELGLAGESSVHFEQARCVATMRIAFAAAVLPGIDEPEPCEPGKPAFAEGSLLVEPVLPAVQEQVVAATPVE